MSTAFLEADPIVKGAMPNAPTGTPSAAYREADQSRASTDATETNAALSVSQALLLTKEVLESVQLRIVGEVSELSDKPGYKAVYFTLRDENSALPCLVWRNVYDRANVELRQGLRIEVSGRFSLYAAKGRMNFDVRSLKAAGEGDLRQKVAALAQKLASEGLMDASRKLRLPTMPERIGLVTSPRGKAVHDVLRTLRRRWPVAEILFAGVAVEGDTAVDQIIAGLSTLQNAHPDVLLLVRGGGSYEDLMPFNDERLARALAASTIPVVTGIGHEPDTTIADMVSSFRASTPTAAAERISPDREEISAFLERSTERLDFALLSYFQRLHERLNYYENRPYFTSPQAFFEPYWLGAEHAAHRLCLAGETLLTPYAGDIAHFAAQLEAYSPLSILARGYALPFSVDGSILRSVHNAELNARLQVRLEDGMLDCRIEGVHVL